VPLIPSGQLYPYVKDRRVYLCPSDPQQFRNISPTNPPAWVPGQTGTSYSMNSLVGLPPPYTADYAAQTLGQIKNASFRMVFFEGNDGWMYDGTYLWLEINSWHSSTKASIGAVALSFADGHAIMWDMAEWGAEQRTWRMIDRIDSRQFGAFMTGVLPPGVNP
jgi:hypothetical protein